MFLNAQHCQCPKNLYTIYVYERDLKLYPFLKYSLIFKWYTMQYALSRNSISSIPITRWMEFGKDLSTT
jgi:hypothetical protein